MGKKWQKQIRMIMANAPASNQRNQKVTETLQSHGIMKNHMIGIIRILVALIISGSLKDSLAIFVVAGEYTKYFPFIVKDMLKHYFPFSHNDNILLPTDRFAFMFLEDT